MGKNEQDSYVSCYSLQVVAIVIGQSVRLGIIPSGLSDPNPHNRVKNDRAKNERPLDQGQHRKGVDIENVVLKRRCTGDQARVDQQVDAHVGTDRNQTAERMQSADQKLMSEEKRTGNGGG